MGMAMAQNLWLKMYMAGLWGESCDRGKKKLNQSSNYRHNTEVPECE
jgi:hypothetical protein